jgi:hypothetical protein
MYAVNNMDYWFCKFFCAKKFSLQIQIIICPNTTKFYFYYITTCYPQFENWSLKDSEEEI